MMARRSELFRMVGISALSLGMAACGATQDSDAPPRADEYQEGDGISIARILGAQSTAPDEFAVIATAPLEMPGDFAALPAPTPGVRSALSPDPVAEAREVLLGSTAPQAEAATARLSASESALLSAAGPSTDPDIRTVLDAEQAEAGGDVYLLDEVFPELRARRGADLKDTIRPAEERVRLSEALPARRDAASGIATIPSGAGDIVPQPLPPAAVAPAVTNPVPDGELIFIPE